MSYCGEQHPEGWFCILLSGHDTPHLSLDNQRVWKGTPGFPIFWETTEDSLPREQTDEFNPTLTQGEYEQAKKLAEASKRSPKDVGAEIRMSQTMGFTGELCGACGSPNTVRNGKCLLCTDCKASGECG